VAAQDYSPLEVIVVDDGSVDHIDRIVDEFPNLNILAKRFDTSVGVSEARNRGLAMASGEFVAFLDADDEWLPQKTSRQIRALTENARLGLTYTDVLLISRGTHRVYSEMAGATATGDDAWKALLASPCVVASSVMVRRALITAAGGFDPTYVVAEDQDLWIRLALRCTFHFDSNPLVRKYQTFRSLSNIHRNLASSVTLPMIESYVARLHQRLPRKERREILARRRVAAGRNAYETGDRLRGAGLILSAAMRGNRPLQNLSYLISASPLGRIVKSLLAANGADRTNPRELADLDAPIFTVVVDASRDDGAATPRHLDKLMHACRRFGVCPAILVSENLLANGPAMRIIGRHARHGDTELGVYLPQLERATSSSDPSFDMAYAREFEALHRLTDAVARRLGRQPSAHKTEDGGPSPARAMALSALGYAADVSAGWCLADGCVRFGVDEDTQILSLPPLTITSRPPSLEFEHRPQGSRVHLIRSLLASGQRMLTISAELSAVGQRSAVSQEFEEALAFLTESAKARPVVPRYVRDLLTRKDTPSPPVGPALTNAERVAECAAG
jgi:glycosyltransferase involved in cell wall biosynthesis